VIGFALTLFISVGGVLAPATRDHLSRPGDILAFSGTVLQVIGLLVGVVFGAAAIREAVRAGRARRPQSDPTIG
jgi:hypothetical protein